MLLVQVGTESDEDLHFHTKHGRAEKERLRAEVSSSDHMFCRCSAAGVSCYLPVWVIFNSGKAAVLHQLAARTRKLPWRWQHDI